MSYWILVITGEPSELKKRLSQKAWPIFQRTRHRTELAVGDKVLLYHGGRFGPKAFVASAKISTGLKMVRPDTYSVWLSEIISWKTIVRIIDIINDLSFIKRKDNWGIYFQGGVSRIPKKDFETILAKAGY